MQYKSDTEIVDRFVDYEIIFVLNLFIYLFNWMFYILKIIIVVTFNLNTTGYGVSTIYFERN